MAMDISGSYNSTQMASLYNQLATGSRINSAADDAAGLAISEKLTSQITGYETGTNNALDMQNLLQTAEGGLSSITDSLQRIKELSLQAKNSIYNDSDRQMMQYEVDGLLQTIKDAAGNTEFNTIKILDGSFKNANVATNPSGNGMKINIENSTLESLGLEGYDLTGDFDISAIDSAIEKVSQSRAKIGAQYNSLSHTINANETTQYNLTAAKSRIADTDYAKAIMEKNQQNVLEQIKIYSIKRQQEQAMQKVSMLGMQ